jgi:hypothetical protein
MKTLHQKNLRIYRFFHNNQKIYLLESTATANVYIEKLRLLAFENNGKLRWNLKNFIHYFRNKS